MFLIRRDVFMQTWTWSTSSTLCAWTDSMLQPDRLLPTGCPQQRHPNSPKLAEIIQNFRTFMRNIALALCGSKIGSIIHFHERFALVGTASYSTQNSSALDSHV